MSLVTTKEMLLDAQKNGYAIGAFNVENMEMVQAVIEAAERMRAPVIMQTTPSTLKYASADCFYHNAKAAVDNSSVKAALHLDHGASFELAIEAFRAGYTSIMIDGSHSSFEENINVSQKVVEVCKVAEIPVEAELGKVGGKEDDLEGGDNNPYTDPLEAKEFVERTGISSLAIAIGTAHGIYQGTPQLDLKRLSEIREAVDIPLVLHGASGVPDSAVQESIARGISKVNYATELRIAFSNGVKAVLAQNPDTIDPKAFGKAGRDNVIKFVMQKMEILGCANRL